MPEDLSLQERLAPTAICFGCGPANPKGLRIRSFPRGEDEVVCEWTPEPHHQAFENVLNGGIIGALLDCHSNWTAIHYFQKRDQPESTPCCVTADYSVQLKRPTPSKAPVLLVAKVVESKGRKAVVEATLEAEGKVCATCRGTFVWVKEDHPAHHRWG